MSPKPNRSISDHESMKRNNQLTVLRQISELGPISRVDLQDKTRLSWGTITSSIKELLGKGVIREIGSVETGVGRRPVELDMNTDRNFVIGLRLGAYQIQSTLVDVKGRVVEVRDVPVNAQGTKQQILSSLEKTVKSLLQTKGIAPSGLAGIGIAAPGAVDFRTGVCHYTTHHPAWKEVPLRDIFEKKFGVPCFVDHVSNCFALSEKLFGFGRGRDSFLSILMGTGVSAGVVIHGEVYRGVDCFAGEFGHTCIDIDGPPCACGNSGCMEAFVSGPAVVRMALERARKGSAVLALAGGSRRKVTAETVYLAAKEGDPAALRAFSDMGRFLGIGVANLVNLFNPECIILGGRVAKAAEFFLPSFNATVAKRAWHASRKDVRVSILERGAVLGAAALVLQDLFSSGLVLGSLKE